MKIITVSDMENGGKPTVYAAPLKGMDYLKSAIHIALHDGCGIANDELEVVVEEAAPLIRDRGYYWYDERLVVEVTDVQGE